jgi:hypothetical protein
MKFTVKSSSEPKPEAAEEAPETGTRSRTARPPRK